MFTVEKLLMRDATDIKRKVEQQESTFLVEKCNCPIGYTGLSCEECADGYERELIHDPFFECKASKCSCNGFSERCNSYLKCIVRFKFILMK